ncbi:hypothetical protein LCGC14_0531240 [marine sediment metagenome]|uniref:Uncharacterized protein n=1 Tax=marine sediment metagenome TaxID=412755 RepID=A0A0F9V3K7_9ZZZZ
MTECIDCEFINLCTIEMCFYDKDEYEEEDLECF